MTKFDLVVLIAAECALWGGFCQSSFAQQQQFPAQLVRKVGRLSRPGALNYPALCEAAYTECTGFENAGREWVAIGTSHGVWFVDATGDTPVHRWFLTRSTANVVLRGDLPAINGDPNGDQPILWRDVAYYRVPAGPNPGRQYVFSVAGLSSTEHKGLHVMDVTNISATTPPTNRVMLRSAWDSAHTLHVDQERGWLYVSGALSGGANAMYIYRINDFDGFTEPTLVFTLPTPHNSHDSFARGPRAYVASPLFPLMLPEQNRFLVLNVSTASPTVVASAQWPRIGLLFSRTTSGCRRIKH